jgi:phosphoenolpyruvate carboxykinase (ATP)
MGGPYGTGKRIDLPSTRRIINAILDGSVMDEGFSIIPVFNLQIPKKLKGVNENLLDPSKAWKSSDDWLCSAKALAIKFKRNFSRFTSNPDTAQLESAGPQLD